MCRTFDVQRIIYAKMVLDKKRFVAEPKELQTIKKCKKVNEINNTIGNNNINHLIKRISGSLLSTFIRYVYLE